jgi:hypothetical protein
MLRVNRLGIVLVLVLVVAVGCSTTQKKSHPLWEKTVTLPNGEVVLDMSGEWDTKYIGYGVFDWLGTIPDILTITQKDNAFTAIKQIGSTYVPKGSETIKGEVDENGFKAVYSFIGSKAMDGTHDWEECKWEISEKGNKVDLDCGERLKTTLTRK